jgi:signal transduction histidine kinase
MVQVMGGSIGASSEKGRGSVFAVRLPVAEQAEVAAR